jgi:hypothetical protein
LTFFDDRVGCASGFSDVERCELCERFASSAMASFE